MYNLTNRLKNKIDVYDKVEVINELGEITYSYDMIKSIWCELKPHKGAIINNEGNTIYANIAYKITIRANTIKITNDMYFMYKGQRYNIKYFNPNYKYNDSIEIFCELVVE